MLGVWEEEGPTSMERCHLISPGSINTHPLSQHFTIDTQPTLFTSTPTPISDHREVIPPIGATQG